mmetsp:Transcript_19456/g.14128  ORF Transcript_19456/g.14128 Transcript_19456/m.14128 type:complete len:136 (-) Transcript_19456:1072-1479(-)
MEICREFQRKSQLKSSRTSNYLQTQQSYNMETTNSARGAKDKHINLDPDASSADENQYQSKVSRKSKSRWGEEGARQKEKLFLMFKWTLLHDDALRQELKDEMNSFAQVLMLKFQKADPHPPDGKAGEAEAQKYH